MCAELTLGAIGTITGISSLAITLWKVLKQEKPIVKIGDTLLWLEKDSKGDLIGKLSFNLNNIGDRSTTIYRIIIILGDDVKTIEGLRNIAPHSSIRCPEKADDDINLYAGKKEVRTLTIIVKHTHKELKKVFELPQIQEWERNALWKNGPVVLTP